MPNPESAFRLNQEIDKPRDHCAVVGIISSAGRDVAPYVKLSLHAQQNRGEDGSGISVFDSFAGNFKTHKSLGLVADALTDEALSQNQIFGSLAVGHNRYATSGSKDKADDEKKQCLQPYVVSYDRRSLSLAHNGNIPEKYLKELRSSLPPDIPFQSDTDSEVIAWRIMFARGASWKEKVANGLAGVKGAYSFVIATDEGDLFGVRDPQGIRPLTVAQTKDGYAFVSETRGLEYMTGQVLKKREVGPGEMVHIDRNGNISETQLFPREKVARCVVESIYLKHPYSQEGGREVRSIRKRMGRALAQEFGVPNDFVIVGVPDSGIEIAEGYAEELNRRREDYIKKDRYRPGRTFISDSNEKRESMLELKFTISDDVAGRKLVIIDDSVIRGNTTRKLVAALRARGATEVHILSGSPPFIDICDLGVDIANLSDLQALQKNGGPDYVVKSDEESAREIGANSIRYLSLKGLKGAIGGDGGFCTNCLTRQHPINDLGTLEADRIYSLIPQEPVLANS